MLRFKYSQQFPEVKMHDRTLQFIVKAQLEREITLPSRKGYIWLASWLLPYWGKLISASIARRTRDPQAACGLKKLKKV